MKLFVGRVATLMSTPCAEVSRPGLQTRPFSPAQTRHRTAGSPIQPVLRRISIKSSASSRLAIRRPPLRFQTASRIAKSRAGGGDGSIAPAKARKRYETFERPSRGHPKARVHKSFLRSFF